MQIDLGCGRAKRPGYIGLDLYPYRGVDIVCDLESGLPFEDNSVQRVYANHVLEHIERFISLMQEIYRVCCPDAHVEVRVPDFGQDDVQISQITGGFANLEHLEIIFKRLCRIVFHQVNLAKVIQANTYAQ